MAVVETESHGQIFVVRINRPERMNALGFEIRSLLADAWSEFHESNDLEVGVFTGTGRAFCAGEDMKESVEAGTVVRYPFVHPGIFGCNISDFQNRSDDSAPK